MRGIGNAPGRAGAAATPGTGSRQGRRAIRGGRSPGSADRARACSRGGMRWPRRDARVRPGAARPWHRCGLLFGRGACGSRVRGRGRQGLRRRWRPPLDTLRRGGRHRWIAGGTHRGAERGDLHVDQAAGGVGRHARRAPARRRRPGGAHRFLRGQRTRGRHALSAERECRRHGEHDGKSHCENQQLFHNLSPSRFGLWMSINCPERWR